MDAKLQQRVQRYGWDRAASDYEPLWEEQLAAARAPLLGGAALVRGQAVLDVACGTGLVSFEAARAVGRSGRVLGTDISGEMVRATFGIGDKPSPPTPFDLSVVATHERRDQLRRAARSKSQR